MNKHIKTILLVALLLVTASCEKELFNGIDDYLFEFSLKDSSGEVYPGLIQGSEISLTIPGNVEFSSLSPIYSLSEQATITPRPEEVSNWEQPQKFVVRSYNGSERAYNLQVKRSEVMIKESFNLTTDAEIEAFAAKKIDRVIGNLVLGATSGTDSISSLAPLANLKEVKYKLIINPTVKTNIEGLNSLTSVGALIIKDEAQKVESVSLPNLQVIFSDFVAGAKTFKSVSLPELTTLGSLTVKNGTLESLLLPKLEKAEGIDITSSYLKEIQLGALKEIGRLKINYKKVYYGYEEQDQVLTTISLPKLEKAGELILADNFLTEEIQLPALKEVGKLEVKASEKIKALHLPELVTAGDITIQRLEAEGLSISFDKLTTAGDLKLQNCSNTESLNIPELKEAGVIVLNGFSNMETLNTLTKLEKAERISIEYCSKVTDISPLFTSLKELKALKTYNLLKATGTLNLSKIEGLEDVQIITTNRLDEIVLPEVVKENVEINYGSASDLEQLIKISGLKEVKDFSYTNLYSSIPVAIPTSLETITGTLKLSGARNATSYEGKNLKKAGSLILSGGSVETVSFPNLTDVENTLDLSGATLREVEMPKLSSIGKIKLGGSYSGYQNRAITNLNFLSNVSQIKEFEIKWCGSLVDYKGLKKAFDAGSITPENWNEKSIQDNAYNPTYEDLKEGRFVAE